MDAAQIQADLEVITQVRSPAEGENFATVLQRLDGLAAEPDLPERLQHYLSRRSYVKALQWLADPNLPHQP